MADAAALKIDIQTESVRKSVIEFGKLIEVAKKTEASLNRVAGANPISKQLNAELERASKSLSAFAATGGDTARQLDLLDTNSGRLRQAMQDTASIIMDAAKSLDSESAS